MDQTFYLTLLNLSIAALGVAIPMFYYIINIRNLWKTRQAQLFMNIYQHFHQPEFWNQYAEVIFLSDWDDYNDFWSKYGPDRKENFSQWMSFGTYFTGIAVLLKKKLIDIKLVDDLVGDYVIWVWRKLAPILSEVSERGGEQPKAAYWIEYLYDEIQKQRKIDSIFKRPREKDKR